MPCHYPESRYAAEEFFELLKERTGGIELPPIGERVPVVPPPCVVAVHGEGDIGVVDGEERFPGEITCAPVEAALIAECQAPHVAAVRAECRGKEREALSAESRG